MNEIRSTRSGFLPEKVKTKVGAIKDRCAPTQFDTFSVHSYFFLVARSGIISPFGVI